MIVFLVGAIGWYIYHQNHQNIFAGSQVFNIDPGTSIRDFSTDLVKHDLIKEEWPFLAWAVYKRSTRNIQAGEYIFENTTTLAEILNQIVKGEVISYPITFIEGWKFVEIMNLLENSEHLVNDLTGLTNMEILVRVGSEFENLEGIFFPDTYYSVRDEPYSVVLRRAHETMTNKLSEIWRLRSPDLPLSTAYEALILASIIEKESAKDEERAHIAGVLVNRLNQSIPLQVDPTVIYGLGETFDGDLKRKHLKLDGLYNTYTRKGLTPTPISNPGLSSLLAATNPIVTKDMFFVARGDGSHEFSETLDEHHRAVRKHQMRN